MLNRKTLCHINVCYYILWCTWWLQLYFVAEGDIGAFKVNRLIPAVNLDRNGEKKLQPTVPDIVWTKNKAFHPGGASKDKVFSVVPKVFFIGERPALKPLMSVVDSVADLQCPVDANMSLSQYCRADLQQCRVMAYYCILLHISNTSRRRSKRAMSMGRNMACTFKRLRSDGSGGSCRLGKLSAWNSWR